METNTNGNGSNGNGNEKMKYSEWFYKVAEKGGDAVADRRLGLCYNFTRVYGWSLSDVLEYHCSVSLRDWPEGTGCSVYPVPATKASNCSITMYSALQGSRDMYKGKYGKSRKRLAYWIAKQFEAVGQ